MKNNNISKIPSSICSGCGACYAVCPQKAIFFTEDSNGFYIPEIIQNLCTNCGLCLKTCSYSLPNLFSNSKDNFFCYQSKNIDDKIQSTSGGFFYDLGKILIEKGWFVAGCIFDEHLNVKHIVSNKLSDLKKMQGSKYIQSSCNECISQCLNLMKNGKKVLFSGTPCQVDGIRRVALILKLQDYLLTISIVCHGTPTPKLWKNYKKWFEEKNGIIQSINFRDKTTNGYLNSTCLIHFLSNESKEKQVIKESCYRENLYIRAFMYNLAERESCFHCKSKGRHGDVLIGDWYPEHQNNGFTGSSIVLVNSERIKPLIKLMNGYTKILTINEIKEKNPLTFYSIEPVSKVKREKFLSKIDDKSFFDKLDKYLPIRFKIRKVLEQIGLYNTAKKIKDKMYKIKHKM